MVNWGKGSCQGGGRGGGAEWAAAPSPPALPLGRCPTQPGCSALPHSDLRSAWLSVACSDLQGSRQGSFPARLPVASLAGAGRGSVWEPEPERHLWHHEATAAENRAATRTCLAGTWRAWANHTHASATRGAASPESVHSALLLLWLPGWRTGVSGPALPLPARGFAPSTRPVRGQPRDLRVLLLAGLPAASPPGRASQARAA